MNKRIFNLPPKVFILLMALACPGYALAFFPTPRLLAAIGLLLLACAILVGSYPIVTRPKPFETGDIISFPLWYRILAVIALGIAAGVFLGFGFFVLLQLPSG